MSTSRPSSFFLLASLLALAGQSSELSADPADLDPGAERYVLWVQLCAPDVEARIVKGIEQETTSIYSAAGVQLAWVERCGGPPIESIHPNSARVYILNRMPGVLLNRVPRDQREGRTMGITWTNPGAAPGAIIYVSTEAVVARASDFSAHPLSRCFRWRALGRVVAHELAHRFIQKSHTATGILKAGFNRRDLTSDNPRSLFFTEKQARHLRSLAAGERRVATVQDSVRQAESRGALAR
jgi:hypothetical protein